MVRSCDNPELTSPITRDTPYGLPVYPWAINTLSNELLAIIRSLLKFIRGLSKFIHGLYTDYRGLS